MAVGPYGSIGPFGPLKGTYNPDGSWTPTGAANVATKFRDSFESYTPISMTAVATSADRWREQRASTDIVQVDGNAAAASYLDVSLDPLAQGTETVIESVAYYAMPLELSVGAHMSQRTLGQEFAIEIVDTGEPLNDVADLAISALSQATTTLTITTTNPHGLSAGKSIGIRGFADSRVNYPSLVIASTPTANQFTATAGPGATIPSLTVGPLSGGFVYFRERLGRANEGTSIIFENATVTNASTYIRSESGDALPSGAIIGNHSATILTTASVQAINAANTYAFQPTNQYNLKLRADILRWTNQPVDSNNQETTIGIPRTQVIPNPKAQYKLRIRATNNKALTVPVAHIQNVAKTGTTTATVTTQTPHGLTVGDVIAAYGVRDQTNFANLTAATAVASVIDANNFTVIWGSAVTASSQSGHIYRVNGGNLPSGLGAIAQVIQSVTRTSNVLTLVGNAAWSGLVIGDYINLAALHDTSGVDLLLDGAYRVRNIATTTLEVEPIAGFAPTDTDIVLTNCGGAVIKRTCLRLSFIRVFDYERARFEVLPAAAGDLGGGVPVTLQGGTTAVTGTLAATQSGAWNVTLLAGAVKAGNFDFAPATLVNDVVSAALTTTTTTAAITPTFGLAYQVNIPVTAISGTTPTLDVRIEESDDNGTNWFTVYDFPRITATGIYRSPVMPLGTGTRVRYVQTVGGTTPSFTRSINRNQSNVQTPAVRQLVDRSIAPNTLNSVTPTLLARDAGNSTQLVVNMGAITTTAPAFQLEGSDDFGLTWYAIGTPLTAVASSTVQVTVNSINAGAIRARVSTAGVGATLGSVMIKAHD
jgi:hypothetical protein